MDREAWWAIVHRLTKSWTWLSNQTTATACPPAAIAIYSWSSALWGRFPWTLTDIFGAYPLRFMMNNLQVGGNSCIQAAPGLKTFTSAYNQLPIVDNSSIILLVSVYHPKWRSAHAHPHPPFFLLSSMLQSISRFWISGLGHELNSLV